MIQAHIRIDGKYLVDAILPGVPSKGDNISYRYNAIVHTKVIDSISWYADMNEVDIHCGEDA